MGLESLSRTPGSIHSKHVRGRGYSCGNGKTSGRGQKGQGSRSGGGVRLGFAGGQTPLYKRLQKRGFTNINRKEFFALNVSALSVFAEGTTVDKALLESKGLIKDANALVKVLGNGELNIKLTVKADAFSASAKDKIEKAGGTIEVI